MIDDNSKEFIKRHIGPSAEDQLKIPPHAQEAERFILGALMSEPSCFERVSEVLQAKDFYMPQHKLLYEIIAGFAGSTADAFTLIERLEEKLEKYPGQLSKASVELAKNWRTDKYLRNLEAMMIVSDGVELLIITGSGDVLEPENNIASVGSGGNFALAAARALYEGKKSSEEIAIKAINIASEICVYTNNKVLHLTLNSK